MALTPARRYDVEVEGARGAHRIRLDAPDLPLQTIGPGSHRMALEISVEGSSAKPARVELTKEGTGWVVTRVRHG